MFASQYMNFYWYSKWWDMMLEDYKVYKRIYYPQKSVKTQ
jgi:hypothetical protein